MKQFLMMTMLFFLGCGNNNTEKIVIEVKGMTCQGCVSSVQNALFALDGVQEVKVSLEKEKAVVTHDKSITNGIILAKKFAEDAGKVAILANGKEFIPEVNPNNVCSMITTKIEVGNDIIYACGDELNCINNAKVMYKQKQGDKWGKGRYDGKLIYFCSPMCKIVFEENPEKFLPKEV